MVCETAPRGGAGQEDRISLGASDTPSLAPVKTKSVPVFRQRAEKIVRATPPEPVAGVDKGEDRVPGRAGAACLGTVL